MSAQQARERGAAGESDPSTRPNADETRGVREALRARFSDEHALGFALGAPINPWNRSAGAPEFTPPPNE